MPSDVSMILLNILTWSDKSFVLYGIIRVRMNDITRCCACCLHTCKLGTVYIPQLGFGISRRFFVVSVTTGC